MRVRSSATFCQLSLIAAIFFFKQKARFYKKNPNWYKQVAVMLLWQTRGYFPFQFALMAYFHNHFHSKNPAEMYYTALAVLTVTGSIWAQFETFQGGSVGMTIPLVSFHQTIIHVHHHHHRQHHKQYCSGASPLPRLHRCPFSNTGVIITIMFHPNRIRKQHFQCLAIN